jgi:NAD(P)-dependent dehydrogenase (short-subunit alcohol dehydrogenase family)
MNSPESPPPNASLAGARVLVVGAGKMGRGTARLAVAAGAEVTLSGRSEQRLQEAAGGVPGLHTLVGDAEDPDQAVALLEQTGPLDHLAVLAGGSGGRAGTIVDTPLSDAQQSFGRFWLSYNLLRAARGRVRDGGSLTLLSGSSGRRPAVGWGFWGSLHGAIESLARSAVLELAPIRVNTVSPGGIGIGMDRQLVPHAGQPEDVASMVLALMSNPAVTAAVVDVDGGERLGTFG